MKAILEMIIPNRCYHCPLCHGNCYTGYHCAVSFYELSGFNRKIKAWELKRPSFCPLKIVEGETDE